MFLVLSYFCLMPRIVMIPIPHAKAEINKWSDEANANDDTISSEIFISSLRMYNFNNYDNMGCVSVIEGKKIKAIALTELINNNLYIWEVTCRDDYSGTLLIKYFSKILKSKFKIHTYASDRWNIAQSYYLDDFN